MTEHVLFQIDGSYKWVDRTPLSYFQWNEWHYPHKVNVLYELEQNPYKKTSMAYWRKKKFNNVSDSWMNNFRHWNNREIFRRKDLCKIFTITNELLTMQPNKESSLLCTASVLGDFRHSDWIKVKNHFVLYHKSNNQLKPIREHHR